MIHRIPSVMGILLASMFAQSVWTDRIAHAQDQPSPTLLNSDAKLQADIVFWQSIVDSEDPRDFRDYLEQFPDGQFVTLAHRRLSHAKDQPSPTLLNSDAKLQADIVFWQSIVDSEDPRVFRDYLEQFPDGQFVTLAHRRLSHAKVAARGKALLHEANDLLSDATIFAVRDNDVEVLEWLKAQGADVNEPFMSNITRMHIAAMFNAVAAMEWLKAQGVDINARDADGKTPMHWAAFGNYVDAMEWLNAQGADVNAQARDGNTPMHSAAEKDAVAAMEWLKAQGIDINARNTDGKTPMDRAKAQDAFEAIAWLKANGGRE